MTALIGSPHRTSTPAPTHHDLSIDVARAACLVVVVMLHAMMVGVSMGANGPVLQNALEGQAWFAPVSWIVQIMPLFFIAGGFSSITQWRRMEQRGASGSDYVRARLARLLRPAVVLVASVGVGLAMLSAVGVPADIVATAGFRISQPLWFLAVYIGCSALVPLLVRAHERSPLATGALMLAGVIGVDAVRIATGVEPIGYLNLALVWLLVQQLGFWLADGALDRLSVRVRLAAAGAAFAALVTLTAAGVYSGDMLVNLNPPTLCLVLLGVVQLMLFSVLQPRIRSWVAAAPARLAAVTAIGSRAMTIYLWHMSVLVALAGVLLMTRMPLPTPLSAEWWATRPAWLLLVVLAVAAVTAAMARFETFSAPRAAGFGQTRRVQAVSVGVAAVLGVVGIGMLLVVGFTPGTALVSVALLGGALVASGAVRVVSRRRFVPQRLLNQRFAG
ncbi:acyltransferase family protein [Leifsonia sp. Root112D2]|uniref:acyltransferase family protein n=1 Tax=Leifsonia sp. Root112D2 TaxID=1736426 RepID=UPI0006F48B5D|nr:acyltransferase [Leifsonia sp. Root112D2]KQV06941.1 hypothetical protein ASC63_06190 [Leifsonia sp. Root112D2]